MGSSLGVMEKIHSRQKVHLWVQSTTDSKDLSPNTPASHTASKWIRQLNGMAGVGGEKAYKLQRYLCYNSKKVEVCAR